MAAPEVTRGRPTGSVATAQFKMARPLKAVHQELAVQGNNPLHPPEVTDQVVPEALEGTALATHRQAASALLVAAAALETIRRPLWLAAVAVTAAAAVEPLDQPQLVDRPAPAESRTQLQAMAERQAPTVVMVQSPSPTKTDPAPQQPQSHLLRQQPLT